MAIFKEVIMLTTMVPEAVGPLSKSDEWDEDMMRSCTWSIHNARGNVALNIACIEGISVLPDIGTLDNYKSEQQLHTGEATIVQSDGRRKLFEYALENFQKNEDIDPRGVETLSNLGTAYDSYARYLGPVIVQADDAEPSEDMKGKALKYLERCIEINAAYEYAYYRLAEHWLGSCSNPGEAKKVVERFRANQLTPSIPGFIDLIRRLEM